MLIHENGENKEENTDQQALYFINDSIDIKINKIDIDRFHKIGRYDKAKKKPISFRGKFAGYNARGRVFCEKQKLKGTEKSIAGSLITKGIG